MRGVLQLIVVLLLAAAGPAQALRCSGRIVSDGDHAFQVRQRCGEPYWIEDYSEVLIAGEDGPLEQRIERRIEAWYYNFGSDKLLRRLVFRDQRLVREDTLGYGYARLGAACDLDTLPAAATTGEVVARCGLPEDRDVRYGDVTGRDGSDHAIRRAVRVEEWIYARDARRPYLLRFVDGALEWVDRLER
jgi:hypothetical protein